MDERPVYEAADPVEAGIVLNLLDGQGIAAVALGVDAWGGRGELPVNIYPRIHLIDAADRPRALALIREYQAEDGDQDEWRCRDCGESSGPRFDQCWNCGSLRTP